MPSWLWQTLITIAIGLAGAWAGYVFTTLGTLTHRQSISEERLVNHKENTDYRSQTLADGVDINRARIRTLEKDMLVHGHDHPRD